MDTDIALAGLASGGAVPIGAECGRGVHDTPPGCAWKHCHEKYVWTPVFFTTSPPHGLVWSYPCLRKGRIRGLSGWPRRILTIRMMNCSIYGSTTSQVISDKNFTETFPTRIS